MNNFRRNFCCLQSCSFLLMVNLILLLLTYYKDHQLCEQPTLNEQSFVDTTRLKLYNLNLLLSNQSIGNSACLDNVSAFLDTIWKEKPTIYAITPTYLRPVQKAELTRLKQTFLLVPKLHWIIVEDSIEKSSLVANFLATSLLSYTHLNAPTPFKYKLLQFLEIPRGVEQRNAGLRWIRENLNYTHNGIVFFADDDNTYSLQLFSEMIKVKKVGVWPVGLVGGLRVESPICDKTTKKVVGFNSAWRPERPFPIDMAGFAINLKLVLEKKNAWFSYDVPSGYQESGILRQMVTRDDLEPLANFCSQVYVWHTRTENPNLESE